MKWTFTIGRAALFTIAIGIINQGMVEFQAGNYIYAGAEILVGAIVIIGAEILYEQGIIPELKKALRH
jgi:hypothetical protein